MYTHMCIYIYIYVYIHTYTHTHTWRKQVERLEERLTKGLEQCNLRLR